MHHSQRARKLLQNFVTIIIDLFTRDYTRTMLVYALSAEDKEVINMAIFF